MEQDEKFSDDTAENFRIENEILKIKLKAQYGDAFHMESNADMPPEVENQFLKNIIAFEENNEKAEYTTIYEKIGRPKYKAAGELSKVEISAALNNLTAIMEANGVGLDICDGPYDDAVIYKFITEELFPHEIEKEPVFGSSWNFIYEEFHPNDKAEITKNTHEFLQHWFAREFNKYSTELAYECITADGRQLSREELIEKLNVFFEAFTEFKNDGYTIDDISFELQDNASGMGFAEGMLQYDAVIENGELIHYEGPYKLYMHREDKWWSILYFVMPGFQW
jgi:hypothetical protein